MSIADVVPALFGLIGTLVGAGLTYHSTRAERRSKEDGEARGHLLNVSNAIHRLWWMTRVGATAPEDLNIAAGGIAHDLRTSSRDARAALLTAGIPYRIASLALDTTDRLAFRWDQRKVLANDPDDAQALVAYLLELLDCSRVYRRSPTAWSRLNAMAELARGRRPLEGISEDKNTFGYLE